MSSTPVQAVLPAPSVANDNPDTLESTHVHAVYDQIAKHFSATRYKPWPVVVSFLESQQVGSLGADIGCGNGKYLGVNKNVILMGSDRSPNLIEICTDRGFDALVADNLHLPYKPSSFDFAISIAVIHHFSSEERRLHALNEILRILKPGGSVLVFVWALEQEVNSKRQYKEQDVFVPWKMPKDRYGANAPNNNFQSSKEKNKKVTSSMSSMSLNENSTSTTKGTQEQKEVVYQRYYHMFVKGELESLVERTRDGVVLESGYDRDNHYVIIQKRINE